MEAVFSTNEFNLPKVLTGKEEIAVLLIRLILLEPGTNPLHPEMGVGLLQRYKHCSNDDIPDLESEIKKQINIYLPSYQQVTINLGIQDMILKIEIGIDEVLYKLTTSDNPNDDEVSLVNLK